MNGSRFGMTQKIDTGRVQPDEGFPQADDDHEGRWLRLLWGAFGCATNPDDFQREHRDRMWKKMIEWASEQEAQNRRAYDSGRYSGYQEGLNAPARLPSHNAPSAGVGGLVVHHQEIRVTKGSGTGVKNPGTRAGVVIAVAFAIHPQRIRDWKRRGLIGPTCDVKTRQEGFDVAEVVGLMARLAKRRPRTVLDNDALESHAKRISLRSMP